MLTNAVPINLSAPILSYDNVSSILERIHQLHPKIDDAGATQYLCDLLNISKLDDIIGDFLIFQEVEPSVSSSELYDLAERILSYNDGDIVKAKYSARNILNTIPKSLDDLIDYTTKEREQSFIKEVLNESLAGEIIEKDTIITIDQLADLLEEEVTFVIDMIGNNQMDTARKTYTKGVPGISERQQMLFKAADYYLNHRIGFKTNSVWLASFTNSNVFGCAHGWLHVDGTPCHNTHFGFKDDVSSARLIIESIAHIKQLLSSAKNIYLNGEDVDNKGLINTANVYLESLIFTLGFLTKQRFSGVDNTEDFITLSDIISENGEMLEQGQLLVCMTITHIYNGYAFIDDEYIDTLQNVIDSSSEDTPPPNYLLPYFDAWNFFVFEIKETESVTLTPLFLKANYCGDSLIEFSKRLLGYLEESALSEFYERMFKGFFTNYLFMSINQNSDNQFLFDEILAVSLLAKDSVDNNHIIQAMAELGHKLSMTALANDRPVKEKHYWIERVKILDKIENDLSGN